MDLENLKKINKEEQPLNLPYLPQICAIPKEQWEAMLNLQSAIAQQLPQMSKTIAKLPTTAGVEEMMTDYYKSVYTLQTSALKTRISEEYQKISSAINANLQGMNEQMGTGFQRMTETTITNISNLLRTMEKTLKHRDMWEPMLKAKWLGIGILISTISFVLLRLLKIW